MIHILTEAMGIDYITPASWSPTAVPGDTIIISANRVSAIKFKNFNGTPTNKYLFTNPTNAKVKLTKGTMNAIQFFESDNFKLLGNNCASETHGIEIDGSNATFGGVRLWCCADWEIAYLYIHNTNAGISQNNNGEDGADWACPSGAWTESNSMGNCRVHHNYISDLKHIYASEGMYLGKSKIGNYPHWSRLEIDHNMVYRTGYDGIQAGQSDSILIHDNYIEDPGMMNDKNQNLGINLSVEGHNIEVYGNTIIRARHNGIVISGTSSGNPSIHDNVVWNAGYGGDGNGIKINLMVGARIINNTVVGSNKYGIKTPSGDIIGDIRYNLLVDNVYGGIFSEYLTKNDNRVSTNIDTEYFKNPAIGDFRLTANSPARDAGVGPGYSLIDFDGNPRPFGSAPDIGAFEYTPYTDLCADVDCPDVCLGNDLWSQRCDPDTGNCVLGQLLKINSIACGYDLCEGVTCNPICDGLDLWSQRCDPDTGNCELYQLLENNSISCVLDPCDDVVCGSVCLDNDLWSQVCDPDTGDCELYQLLQPNSLHCTIPDKIPADETTILNYILLGGLGIMGLGILLLAKNDK